MKTTGKYLINELIKAEVAIYEYLGFDDMTYNIVSLIGLYWKVDLVERVVYVTDNIDFGNFEKIKISQSSSKKSNQIFEKEDITGILSLQDDGAEKLLIFDNDKKLEG